MPLKHVLGVDHVVVAVRDLDAAARAWAAIGFAMSPRGTHSPHLGTGNYTTAFGEDYLELLGVLTPTAENEPTRTALATRGEGLDRTAFTTDDAAAGVRELQGRGLAPVGPIHFGRPVDLPDGRKGEARFNVFRWPADRRPGGMGIFACEHLTRDMVWIPEIRTHANGARRIVRIEILTADPKGAADGMAGLIDQPASPTPDGWRVPSGDRRAGFLFYDKAGFERLYPAAVRDGAPAEGAVALVLGTEDIARASAASGGVAHGSGQVSVPARRATGVIVGFVPV